MIDIVTYRARVGQFCPCGAKRKGKSAGEWLPDRGFCYNYVCDNNKNSFKLIFLFYIFFILFAGVFMLSVVMECAASHHRGLDWLLPSLDPPDRGLPFLSTVYIKLGFLVIMSFGFNYILCKKTNTSKRFTPAMLFFGSKTTRVRQLVSCLILGLLTFNFLLIAIINPSLLNPGPQNLSIYYQNVQGLIPFSNLSDTNPLLNRTKILELNTYIHANSPDIVMLTETWLKRSIKDKEVIENGNYNIYRNDRSLLTHPPDPNNPKKFRKNGGGVLIAIRNDISATFKRISLCRGAEIVAIDVRLNGSKFIFCNVYRVGNLGNSNYTSIMDSLGRFMKGKKASKIFILGDFNFSGLSWPIDENAVIQDPIELLFTDSFKEFGLDQVITSPTHIKGRTLDLLLTNHINLIHNLQVSESTLICKSDHYPITFEIKTNVKRTKPAKRKMYNFKKANWDAINRELWHTNWDALLDNTEPEVAWGRFKSVLFSKVDRYIPKITIKSEYQPPWFDSDVHDAYRDKQRAHKNYKASKSRTDELKFSNARRNFKNLSCQKMRDNFYNTDDPALITKKFWSHVKQNSKSHRLPEAMYRSNCHRNNSQDIANLFNTFFYEQFSDSSSYNIDFDWSNDASFEIDFCHQKIQLLLSRINSNKACGPDGIHGKILKNCSFSLAYPLSIMYRISYNTGCIPKDWKVANIVPVHKKGAKENIENYRPISLTSLVMKTFERILKDEILLRTSSLLDERQHGFLSKKSCTTNMAEFSNSLALSLNDCMRTDIVYFDFSKAFDSVNHDLLLHKLKNLHKIDGRLLKFIVSYLSDREQCVILGNTKSEFKPVLSAFRGTSRFYFGSYFVCTFHK